MVSRLGFSGSGHSVAGKSHKQRESVQSFPAKKAKYPLNFMSGRSQIFLFGWYPRELASKQSRQRSASALGGNPQAGRQTWGPAAPGHSAAAVPAPHCVCQGFCLGGESGPAFQIGVFHLLFAGEETAVGRCTSGSTAAGIILTDACYQEEETQASEATCPLAALG